MEAAHCRKLHGGWRRRTYCGMVGTVDEGVANVTAALREARVLDSTVVIFTSDNGGLFFVGGLNYPLRGAKASAFEGGVRVPAALYVRLCQCGGCGGASRVWL